MRAISPFTSKNKSRSTSASAERSESIVKVKEWSLDDVNLKQALLFFYSRYNPSKIHDIDDIIRQYIGDEDRLFTSLCSRYEVSKEEMNKHLNRARKEHSPSTKSRSESPYLNHRVLRRNEVLEKQASMSSQSSAYHSRPQQSSPNNRKRTTKFADEAPETSQTTSFINQALVSDNNRQRLSGSQVSQDTPVSPSAINEMSTQVKKMHEDLMSTREEVVSLREDNRELKKILKSKESAERRAEDQGKSQATEAAEKVSNDLRAEIESLKAELKYIFDDKSDLLQLIQLVYQAPSHPRPIVESYLAHYGLSERQLTNMNNNKQDLRTRLEMALKHRREIRATSGANSATDLAFLMHSLEASAEDAPADKGRSSSTKRSSSFSTSAKLHGIPLTVVDDDVLPLPRTEFLSLSPPSSRPSSPQPPSAASLSPGGRKPMNMARSHSVILKEILHSNENLHHHMQYTQSHLHKLIEPSVPQNGHTFGSSTNSTTIGGLNDLRVTSGGLLSPERKRSPSSNHDGNSEHSSATGGGHSSRRYMNINSDKIWDPLANEARSSSPMTFLDKWKAANKLTLGSSTFAKASLNQSDWQYR